MNLTTADKLKINDEVDGLGYLVASHQSMYQQQDGTVVKSVTAITLYFRSRPFSSRGKIRGVDRGDLDCGPQDKFIVIS